MRNKGQETGKEQDSRITFLFLIPDFLFHPFLFQQGQTMAQAFLPCLWLNMILFSNGRQVHY